MSFNYDPSLGDDVSLVRFHIGDVDEDGYFVDDEAIQYWVDAGSAESAVIACIKFILSQLSRPNFSLDWLSVSGMKEAKQGYEELLRHKEWDAVRLSGRQWQEVLFRRPHRYTTTSMSLPL